MSNFKRRNSRHQAWVNLNEQIGLGLDYPVQVHVSCRTVPKKESKVLTYVIL